MTMLRILCLGLVSTLCLPPAYALQIEGEEDGEPFREIYQDGYYLRLENDQLMLRYRKEKCLMVSEQGDVYVEDLCARIADEISKAMSKEASAIEQQHGINTSAQSAALDKMMQAYRGETELNKVGSGKVSGYDSTIFSTGSSKYWVSPKLLSEIKKNIDYKQFLKTQEQFEAAFSELDAFSDELNNIIQIEKDLEKIGYLMKKSDAGMSPVMMDMLPPETRKQLMAQMGEEPVVLNVTSVNTSNVDIKKIKPSGRKVTIAEYIEVMFRDWDAE